MPWLGQAFDVLHAVRWPVLAADLLLVVLILLLLRRLEDSRTLRLVKGYVLLVVAAWLAQRLQVTVTAKLLEALVLISGFSLAVLLQGPLRRLLEQLGALLNLRARERSPVATDAVAVVVEAVARMSKSRCGGLVVWDMGNELQPEEFLNPGVNLDAALSVEILQTVFAGESPLHDGAVLLRGARVVAAKVILPLSSYQREPGRGRQRQPVEQRYGTRHLAALGITERFDSCFCVVVSEQSGTISFARKGRLERPITSSRLKELLLNAVRRTPATGESRRLKRQDQRKLPKPAD